jgi:hypothetical protein
MHIGDVACCLTLALMSATMAMAQEAKTEVKHTAARQTSPASGRRCSSIIAPPAMARTRKGTAQLRPV